MTFFKKLFGFGSKTKASAEATVAPVKPAPAEDLFKEDRHPDLLLEEMERMRPAKREQTLLGSLMDRDYQSMGEHDGYDYAHLDRMEHGVRQIALDFRKAYQSRLQELGMELISLEEQMTDSLREELPDKFRDYSIMKKKLCLQRDDLMQQMDLALTGEGYAEHAIHRYKAGFRAGYSLYAEQKLIFPTLKTL